MNSREMSPGSLSGRPGTNGTARRPTPDLDRTGLEILSFVECERLLTRKVVGRIGFSDRGETVILPVNYAWHRGTVVFRSGVGSKLSAAVMNSPLSFEIDEMDPVEHSGWSVLVKGVGEEVVAEDETFVLDGLPVRPWTNPSIRTAWVRIVADEVSGRRIVHPHR